MYFNIYKLNHHKANNKNNQLFHTIAKRLVNSPLTLKLINNESNSLTKSNRSNRLASDMEDVEHVGDTFGTLAGGNNGNSSVSNSCGGENAFEEITFQCVQHLHILIGAQCGADCLRNKNNLKMEN